MKSTPLVTTVCLGLAALAATAWAQTPPSAGNAATASAAAPAAPGTLRFNFRGAPLETVLNYMSEAAGFTIVLETSIRGTVDMFSAQPITRDEAVNLLNLALNKNGYTSIVQGRTIVISSKEDAKKKNLPIRTGNNAEEIPMNAEMYIQIIPLGQLDATTAARDLGGMLPSTSSITPNVDSNSLIVTDTNINLRQVVTLVNALDTSSDSVSTTRVFELKNADPNEMAQLLTTIYTPTTTGRGGFGQAGGGRGGFGGQAGGRGGRGAAGGFGAGGFGGGRGGRGGGFGTAGRSVPVVAVADPRTLSVVVSASKDEMPDIALMVAQLDASSARKQKVFVLTMENANVIQVETALKALFPTNRATTTNAQSDALQQRVLQNIQDNAQNTIQLGTQGPATGGRGN